ncbi:hypothetical protein [Streptomyces sp. NPDC049949]|uniref:hypothetical protein n=1 Tax=Streptomyces sp. NPDC049949 TaxID=3154627 RepID=UPI00344557AE
MAPHDDRAALDLLDAHLEALWDAAAARARGVEAPLPGVPGGLAGSAADPAPELLRWGLGGLARMPREPADLFAREAGTLVAEFRRRRSPWNAAALRLLGDPCVFVATGPRRHEDWARDVLALMRREVPDPRGWLRMDPDRLDDSARHAAPAYPFAPPPAAELPRRVHRLEPHAAVAALTVMAEEWTHEPRPALDRPDVDGLTADARTLLARYGPDARFWTNAVAAAADPAPDFLATGLRGHSAHSFLTGAYVNGLDLFGELGLIAVSGDEVGVFWSIGAY